MAYVQKPNTGSLFRNNKKSSEKSPDYTGSCLIDGKEMKIGAWLKTSKKGEKFFSMSFQVPQGRAPQANGYQKPMAQADDWQKGDEVPF